MSITKRALAAIGQGATDHRGNPMIVTIPDWAYILALQSYHNPVLSVKAARKALVRMRVLRPEQG